MTKYPVNISVPTSEVKDRIPRKGNCVGVQGHEGTFVVSEVNLEFQTVELHSIGQGVERLHGIPWKLLSYRDELDESQNALRVVREATED